MELPRMQHRRNVKDLSLMTDPAGVSNFLCINQITKKEHKKL